jgi:hypothetical protein
LLIGEPVGIGNKQIGHAPKRINAFVFRSALDRFFELDNKLSRPRQRAFFTDGGGGTTGMMLNYNTTIPAKVENMLSLQSLDTAFGLRAADPAGLLSERYTSIQARPLT